MVTISHTLSVKIICNYQKPDIYMFKIFKSFYTAEWKCMRHSSRTLCNPGIGQGRKNKKKFFKKKKNEKWLSRMCNFKYNQRKITFQLYILYYFYQLRRILIYIKSKTTCIRILICLHFSWISAQTSNI